MTPVEIKAARLAAGLTQLQAAALIHCGETTWQGWELGTRKMHPAFWQLFQIKACDGPALLEAAKLALGEAESWVRDQLEGTQMHEKALADLVPIRTVIEGYGARHAGGVK